jgi:hypothetical protein
VSIDAKALLEHSLFLQDSPHYTNKFSPKTEPEIKDAEEDSLMFFNRSSLEDLDRRFYTRRARKFGEELSQSLEHLSISKCTSSILGYMAELFLFDQPIPNALRTVKVSLSWQLPSPPESELA